MERRAFAHLADLPQRRTDSGPLIRLGAAAAVIALFVGAAALAQRWTIWQAESFGDRRLLKPSAAECQMARVLIRDLRDHDRAALLGSVGAGDEKLELRAFAWRSDGALVPPGMDWRNCPGLGRYVRAMGMAPMGSGDERVALYLSRADLTPAGDAATVAETFRSPWRGRPTVVKAWRAELRRGRDGAWTLTNRTAAPLPKDDFVKN